MENKRLPALTMRDVVSTAPTPTDVNGYDHSNGDDDDDRLHLSDCCADKDLRPTLLVNR